MTGEGLRSDTSARRFPRFIRHALFALCLASFVPGAPVLAQTPEQVQQAAERAIHKLDLQTELPHEADPPRIKLKLPAELLWVVVAIAIAILLYAFRDMIPMLRARSEGAWSGEEELAGENAPREPAAVLGKADELAAEGRFVEAMHVLLLQGLAEIRSRLDTQFADSLTSREILRSAKLSEAGRSSLRDIVHRVEWTYFGEHPAAWPDYVACRASYNALTQALAGSAA
jgi:hypothetical protein